MPPELLEALMVGVVPDPNGARLFAGAEAPRLAAGFSFWL